MSRWKYHATVGAVKELLVGGGEFNEAGRVIADLTPEQATARIGDAPYTIATLVAHLHYWQQRSLGNAGLISDAPARVPHVEDSFPPVAPEEWDALRQAFLHGIEIGQGMTAEQGETDSRNNQDTSIGYDMAESALHNAYHIGQIVLLRRMAGYWPPAAGDANDW